MFTFSTIYGIGNKNKNLNISNWKQTVFAFTFSRRRLRIVPLREYSSGNVNTTHAYVFLSKAIWYHMCAVLRLSNKFPIFSCFISAVIYFASNLRFISTLRAVNICDCCCCSLQTSQQNRRVCVSCLVRLYVFHSIFYLPSRMWMYYCSYWFNDRVDI